MTEDRKNIEQTGLTHWDARQSTARMMGCPTTELIGHLGIELPYFDSTDKYNIAACGSKHRIKREPSPQKSFFSEEAGVTEPVEQIALQGRLAIFSNDELVIDGKIFVSYDLDEASRIAETYKNFLKFAVYGRQDNSIAQTPAERDSEIEKIISFYENKQAGIASRRRFLRQSTQANAEESRTGTFGPGL
ncbi:hypothetical protein KY346_04675 [Candidatus Woesearchaeota archaeon]|nr:hypothetical protein [Candidatus Woesearchaeota archaeon]